MAINVLVTSNEVASALNGLEAALGNVDPALRQIGEYLTLSTKERFQTTVGPDGKTWERNSDATLANYGARFANNNSKRGRERVSNKKPGTGETRQLQTQIFYNVRDGVLEVGSPMIYSASFQFGAKKSQYGPRTPWGDIPARPFLGLSESDEAYVLDILAEHLMS